MKFKFYEDEKIKLIRSEGYNFNFDKTTGIFKRWGKTEDDKDDPVFAPAPEILDLEATTSCMGVPNKDGKNTLCNFCFPTGTKIKTSIGEKNIEDIKIGDKVLSSAIGKLPYIKENKVLEIYLRPINENLIVITLENGEKIKVTENHSIFVKRKGWIKAGNLTETDELINVKHYNKCKYCKKITVAKHSYKRYYCSKKCHDEALTKICVICKKTVIMRGKKDIFCQECVPLSKNNSFHPLRNIHSSMLHRCYNQKRNNYCHYGAKGITVSKDWLIFDNFIKDMGIPKKGMTLDRIDNSKGYCLENCRWVSINEQRINRGRFKNTSLKYKGVCKYLNKYKATIRHNGESLYLGLFKTEKSAAKAYNEKVKEFYPKTYKQYINKIMER